MWMEFSAGRTQVAKTCGGRWRCSALLSELGFQEYSCSDLAVAQSATLIVRASTPPHQKPAIPNRIRFVISVGHLIARSM